MRVYKNHSRASQPPFFALRLTFPRSAIPVTELGSWIQLRLALAICQGVEGGRDAVVLFVDCLLGTANYQLPPDDRDQAIGELQKALDADQLSEIAAALRYWK